MDFTEARYSEWQWHQLGHMQVCISLQTDNHASTNPPIKTNVLQHKINTKKLNPGLVTFYDIQPGNGTGVFSKEKISKGGDQ